VAYEITLPNTGSFATVSEEDAPLLSKFTWYQTDKGYAATSISGATVLMHRFVMDAKGRNNIVDHINGDRLDNRRENLRIVSHSVNNQSRSPIKKFPFIGVYFNKERRKYYAEFKKEKVRKKMGPFETPFDAALSYDREIIKALGENAQTNEKFLQKLLAKFRASK
jgi:hypothetical protein